MLNLFNSSMDVLHNKSPLFSMKIEKIFKGRAIETGEPRHSPPPTSFYREIYIFFFVKLKDTKLLLVNYMKDFSLFIEKDISDKSK